MEHQLEIRERRNWIRLKLICPVLLTRFDKHGRQYCQRTSRLINVGIGGVRLQSSFRIDAGEVLDMTIALGNNSVTLKGKVIHVNPSGDQGFESGVSIEDIENQDRLALTQFLHWIQGQVGCVEWSFFDPARDKARVQVIG